MCARSGQKKYNKLCPLEKDTEIRRERKNDFRGLDVGEGVYEGKMKNRKKLRQQERKKGEIGRKKAARDMSRTFFSIFIFLFPPATALLRDTMQYSHVLHYSVSA